MKFVFGFLLLAYFAFSLYCYLANSVIKEEVNKMLKNALGYLREYFNLNSPAEKKPEEKSE